MAHLQQYYFALKLFSVLGCGLMAGVFFAFSSFVMNALARLQPTQGIAAMQSINITVINPLFMAPFLGTEKGLYLSFSLFAVKVATKRRRLSASW